MFFQPHDAVEFVAIENLKTTMLSLAEFSFALGTLGEGATDATYIGIQTPSGIYGDTENENLRFDPSYMQMAAEGSL